MKNKNLIIVLVALGFMAVGFIRNQQSVKAEIPEVVQSSGKEGTNIGDQALDIDLPGVDGKTSIKLSSLKGNYVLLDFWASWCRPCRVENPTLVKAYEKYKDQKMEGCGPGQSFTIYSVSLDRDRNAWVNAIKQDNLTWPYHVSDLQFWNSAAAKAYGINSIPANVLIDPQGKIIAKNLRGGNLMMALDKYIGK